MRSKFKYVFPFFNMIPNKLVRKLNVFIARVNYRGFSEVYGANVVASYLDNSKINTVVTEFLFHPNNPRVIANHRNVFCLSCR